MTKKIVFVSGNFNILHPGHLRLLRFARELGDRLIVGVQSDRLGGVAVHLPEKMRLEGVISNNWVDEAFIYDEQVENIISSFKPDIVVKGKEHTDTYNVESDAVKSYGGKLVFSSGEATFSSLDLIRKDLFEMSEKPINFPIEFAKRHNLTAQSIKLVLDKFINLNVCVVGDLIIDEYISCDPLGMSQEDPTIVVTPVDTQRFIGGAGIVAAHAANLGANVNFISVTGNDSVRDYAYNELKKYGINVCLLVDDSRPTTLKQRYRAKDKTLLRVSHLHQGSIDKNLQNKIIEFVDNQMKSCDVLIFSDFNYGCLPQFVVDHLTKQAKIHGVVLAADSQCSSQTGDVSRFTDMDLLTPTEREVRLSLRNREDGLVIIAEELRNKARAKNVMLKLASEGVLLHFSDKKFVVETDKLPALNPYPLDVAGAGDSMLTAAALTLGAGGGVWIAACLGSLSAAIQVGRLGNKPINASDIKAVIDRINL
jgi:rfaE bifunctional protein kinase chain/domain